MDWWLSSRQRCRKLSAPRDSFWRADILHQECSQILHPGHGPTWANFGSLQSMKYLDPAFGVHSHGVPARQCSIRSLQITGSTASKGPVTEEAGPPGGSCLCAAAPLPVPAMSTTMAVPTTATAPMLFGCRFASESQNNQRQSHPPGYLRSHQLYCHHSSGGLE